MKYKKRIFVLAALTAVLVSLGAQETEQDWQRYPYTLGGGVEMNMNTREGWGQGYVLQLDRHLFTPYLAAGVRAGMNTDYKGITNIEGDIYVRAYPFKQGLGGAFAQLGWGVSSFSEDELRPLVMLFDFSAGYRFFFLKGFYAEGSVRTGYPFQWAFAVTGGHRFSF
jgi:hypothetical protein